MTKDDSFSLTPPSKARSKADNALDEFARANSDPIAPRSPAPPVQTYGQKTPLPVAKEPTKRVTIDMPVSLHMRVRMGCLKDGTSISELVRNFLDRKYADDV